MTTFQRNTSPRTPGAMRPERFSAPPPRFRSKEIAPPFLSEHPFESGAGTAAEASVCPEVAGELHLASETEVVAAEMASDIVPELGFGDEHAVRGLGQYFAVAVAEQGVVLPPEVGEAGEGQPGEAEEVLYGPGRRELHGHAAAEFRVGVGDVFVQHLQVQGGRLADHHVVRLQALFPLCLQLL